MLSGQRCGNVWFQLGREVGFQVQNCSLRVGRIVGHRKGWIAIDVWIPRGEVTRSSRHKNGLQNWMKPVIAERITIPDSYAFPLSTTLLCSNPDELYRVDGSSEWIEKWVKHTDPENNVEMDIDVCNEEHASIDVDKEILWRYEKGIGLENMSPDEANFQTETLWAMSDGGVTNAGTDSARAGYGYIIRSNKQTNGWGHFEYTMSGRGMVEGNNLCMDSTRAEARGLLASMTRILCGKILSFASSCVLSLTRPKRSSLTSIGGR